MSDFHDVRFPLSVSFGATGGPERRTDIVTLGSGFEARNQRWSQSRRRYDGGTGMRNRDDLETVVRFFEERRGRLYGFRYADPLDFKSCLPSGVPAEGDQDLGVGDGTTAAFALIKRYGTTFAPYDRAITLPVAGSVVVAVNGVTRFEGGDFTLEGGVITFLPHAVPAAGAPVTAGFLFDVPVRFDTDRLEIDVASFDAGVAPSIPMVEILQ